jgi:hypothetical protein
MKKIIMVLKKKSSRHLLLKCIFSQMNYFYIIILYNIKDVRILKKSSKMKFNFFSFGQSMKKIIMFFFFFKFKTSLLECIKLQDSNAFSIKLNKFFP